MVARTPTDITALVAEAILIDKEIVAQLNTEDVDANFNDIYDGGAGTATELSSLSAAERVQRIVSTLIEEDNKEVTNSKLEELNSYLNIGNAGNLASAFSAIESHLNANQEKIKLEGISGIFLQNETLSGSVVGRVLSQDGDTLILDNVTSISASGNITGSQSGENSSYSSWHQGNSLAQDLIQKTMSRLYISDISASSTSISIPENRVSWSRPSSGTINETGTATVNSNRRGIDDLWLVDSMGYFPLEGTTIDKIAITGDNITGSGTSSLTFTSTYGSAGTYYVVNGRDEQLVAIINVTSESWIIDEIVQGDLNGYGYVESYSLGSDRGIRYLDIINVRRNFKVGETITGSESSKTAQIIDILYFNHEHETYSSSSLLGEAALYKLYVEEGEILKVDKNIPASDRPTAVSKIRTIAQQARSI